jgi:hypothetical protein
MTPQTVALMLELLLGGAAALAGFAVLACVGALRMKNLHQRLCALEDRYHPHSSDVHLRCAQCGETYWVGDMVSEAQDVANSSVCVCGVSDFEVING